VDWFETLKFAIKNDQFETITLKRRFVVGLASAFHIQNALVERNPLDTIQLSDYPTHFSEEISSKFTVVLTDKKPEINEKLLSRGLKHL
jgi:hypothetical protein